MPRVYEKKWLYSRNSTISSLQHQFTMRICESRCVCLQCVSLLTYDMKWRKAHTVHKNAAFIKMSKDFDREDDLHCYSQYHLQYSKQYRHYQHISCPELRREEIIKTYNFACFWTQMYCLAALYNWYCLNIHILLFDK